MRFLEAFASFNNQIIRLLYDLNKANGDVMRSLQDICLLEKYQDINKVQTRNTSNKSNGDQNEDAKRRENYRNSYDTFYPTIVHRYIHTSIYFIFYLAKIRYYKTKFQYQLIKLDSCLVLLMRLSPYKKVNASFNINWQTRNHTKWSEVNESRPGRPMS